MPIAAKTLTVELHEDVLELLGPPETLARKVQETLVLDLLRRARISQGQAARLLDVTRYDILDLMTRDSIPSGPQTAEEMRQDIENARRFTQSASTDGGG